jgi:hypothetical protein
MSALKPMFRSCFNLLWLYGRLCFYNNKFAAYLPLNIQCTWWGFCSLHAVRSSTVSWVGGLGSQWGKLKVTNYIIKNYRLWGWLRWAWRSINWRVHFCIMCTCMEAVVIVPTHAFVLQVKIGMFCICTVYWQKAFLHSCTSVARTYGSCVGTWIMIVLWK